MDWQSLVFELREYRQILVTGPQRSGTTIGAHVLARELQLPYIDEAEIAVDDVGKAFRLYHQSERFVLQAPGLSAYCHLFPGAVVFMIRDPDEILSSERRIKWKGEMAEMNKYFASFGRITEVKYNNWKWYQKDYPGRFELSYASLSYHPLFVPAEKRRQFHSRQWRDEA